MSRSVTRGSKFTKVSAIGDDDTILAWPSSGDIVKGITKTNLEAQFESSDSENTVEVSGTYQQLITDTNIIFTGPGTLNLIQASTAIHGVTIKSKLGGGDVTVTPFSGDTVNASLTLVLGSGVGQTIAPITLDWEVMG